MDTDMFKAPKCISHDTNHGYIKAEAAIMVANGSMAQKALEIYHGEFVNEITQRLGDQIREYFNDYFEHLGAYQMLEESSQVSDANYIGLQEAIQILGIPNKVNIVYDTLNYSASGGFLMPYYNGACTEIDIPGPSPFDGRLAAFDIVSTARGSVNIDDIGGSYTFECRVAFETVPKYVDITFRMPYTDDLRDYIPNIEAMYWHLKDAKRFPNGHYRL